MTRDIKTKTISEFFRLKKLSIPNFQRDFVWRAEESIDLLDDIINEMTEPSDDGVYLGSIIVYTDGADTFKIVDGQQRITSLMILLIAIRVRAENIGCPELANSLQALVSFQDLDEDRGVRLETAKNIKLAFDQAAKSDWAGGDIPEPANAKYFTFRKRSFLKIYKSFSDALERFSSVTELRKVARALLETNISLMVLDNVEQAFELYERTNARGVNLEISDLLKNYLFSNLDESNHEKFQEDWDEIEKNSAGSVFRLLKSFQTSFKGMTPKKKLYSSLKTSAKNKEIEFAEDVFSFSEFYALLHNASLKEIINQLEGNFNFDHLVLDESKREKFARSIQALNSFGIRQSIPLLYAMFSKAKEASNNQDPKASKFVDTYLDIVESMEKFHFLNNAICKQPGNEIERLYAEYSVKFRETSNYVEFNNIRNDIIVELKKKTVTKSNFTENFCAIHYQTSQANISLTSYIFDRLNNFGKSPPIKIFNPDESLKKRSFNRDHIYPQKYGGDVADNGLKLIHNIGNLIVLPSALNNDLQNILPSAKFAKLTSHTDELSIIRELVEKYSNHADDWNDEVIESRSIDLAHQCYDEVFRIST